MSDKNLLVIIIVILLSLFSVMVIEATRDTPEEKVANSISNVADTINDTIKEKTAER